MICDVLDRPNHYVVIRWDDLLNARVDDGCVSERIACVEECNFSVVQKSNREPLVMSQLRREVFGVGAKLQPVRASSSGAVP